MISVHSATEKTPNRMARGWRDFHADTVDELGWIVMASTWSPIVWRGGERRQANFLYADFLALDFEDPQFTLVRARETFAGLTHLVGTTRSHGIEKHGWVGDRFRVVIPFGERITDLGVYLHNMESALKLYDRADDSAKDGARMFFACKTIVWIESDGEPWDVEPLPVAAGAHTRTQFTPPRHFSPFAVRCLETVMPLHTRNTACFRLGCEFSRLGFGIDDTIARICSSPTYASIDMRTHRELFAEIEKCVTNGFKDEAAKRITPAATGVIEEH